MPTYFDNRYNLPPVDPPEEGIVHYGPGDRPLCGNESPYAVYTEEPTRWPAAKTAWSWSPRICRTRTPGTEATASTADRRSPPLAPSSGAGWSGAHARTVEGQDGE